MGIDLTMNDVLEHGPPGAALACVDVRSGLVLGVVGRSVASREVASAAALTISQLCVIPRLDGGDEGEEDEADEAIFVSAHGVHAFARIPGRPEHVLVGVADATASIALLLAWVKTSCRAMADVA